MHLVTRKFADAPTVPPERRVRLRVERRLFLKRRWRGVAEDGTELGFDLAERLTDGCVVWRDEAREIVVEQIPEPVLEIPLPAAEAAARLAWMLGNLHQPVEMLSDRLRVGDDLSVRRLLEREAVAYTAVEVAFRPLRVAAHAAAEGEATGPVAAPEPAAPEVPAGLPDWLALFLQLNDSQFPSGSYAHSLGLEQLVADGRVRTAEELESFLAEQIVPGLRALELPFLARAHAAAAREDLTALAEMDEEWEAWKASAELRRASRQIGERRLALLARVDPNPFVLRCQAAGRPRHQLLVLAVETRRAPLAAAGLGLVYQTLSGYALAALKLLRLGPERAQAILRARLLAFTADPRPLPAEPAWFNPLLDVASLRHARAPERMFMS
jgi:urease accessory protein